MPIISTAAVITFHDAIDAAEGTSPGVVRLGHVGHDDGGRESTVASFFCSMRARRRSRVLARLVPQSW